MADWDYITEDWPIGKKPERFSSTHLGRCGCGRTTMMLSKEIARLLVAAYECGTCYEVRMTAKRLNQLVNGKDD